MPVGEVRRTPSVLVRATAASTATSALCKRVGLDPVAGADEAGRGACAGPLVAAATILGDAKSRQIDGLKDSKLLTAAAAGALLRRDHREGHCLVRGLRSSRGSVTGSECTSPTSTALRRALLPARRAAHLRADRRIQRRRARRAGAGGVEGRSGRGLRRGGLDHCQGDPGPDHVRAATSDYPEYEFDDPQGLLHRRCTRSGSTRTGPLPPIGCASRTFRERLESMLPRSELESIAL